MSIGEDLANEFDKLTGGVFYDEVILFTKLQDAFIAIKNSHKYAGVIDIIHGNSSVVEFENNSTYITGKAPGTIFRCELADMLFIVFSRSREEIRLMYMQNKNGKTACKSQVDLKQYHLLKDRRAITSVILPECVFGNRNILRDARLDSIGSYGVFYEAVNGVDMAYYPASELTLFTATGISDKRIAIYERTNFEKVVIRACGYQECLGQETLKNFVDSLVDMQIGTPFVRGDVEFEHIGVFLREKGFDWLINEGGDNEGDFIQNINMPNTYIFDADILQNGGR